MSREHATSTAAPPRASLPRCLAVWTAITASTAAGTVLCVTSVLETLAQVRHASPDAAVLLVAAIAGALLCPWVWLVATSTVLDHLRGRAVRGTGLIRRLVLAACGVAVTFAAVPAHAYETSATRAAGGAAQVLDGLPFPDRASNSDSPPAAATPPPADANSPSPVAARSPAASSPAPEPVEPAEPVDVHVVQSGDSLWQIATEQAGTTAAPQVQDLVTAIHDENRAVIGPDPDLILPGQEIRLPDTTQASEEASR